MNNQNQSLRIARMESVCNAIRANMNDVMWSDYKKAVERNDKDQASQILRAIRNKLLEESDREMFIDKFGLGHPDGANFVSWLGFLRGLRDALTGKTAAYRQALRDLPEQPGFPFTVKIPDKPWADTKSDKIAE